MYMKNLVKKKGTNPGHVLMYIRTSYMYSNTAHLILLREHVAGVLHHIPHHLTQILHGNPPGVALRLDGLGI